MGKNRCFLGILATLFVVLIVNNSFAAGSYTCSRKYLSCHADYYLSGTDVGNSCQPCGANSTAPDGNKTSFCTCDSGFTADGTPNGATTVTGGADCEQIQFVCEPGEHLGAGRNTCGQCPKGYYCEGGSFYFNADEDQGLTACDSGYTSETGAAARTECFINVSAGHYIENVGDSTEATCTAGTSKAAHTVYYGSTSTCDICDENSYSDAGAASCIACNTAKGYVNSGDTADAHAGVGSCKVTCPAGQYVPVAGEGCQDVGDGSYTDTEVTVPQDETSSAKQCSALSGVSITGGTYTSVSPRNAATTCQYTAPEKDITGCATVTPNTVTYTEEGTWPESVYSVTADGGYIIAGNNTADATCTICKAGTFSEGGTAEACEICPNWTYSMEDGASSCTSCPTVSYGWTKVSGTGWDSYEDCQQTSGAPANCRKGGLTQSANSPTSWGSSVASDLEANLNFYVDGSSCVSCPNDYPKSDGGNITSDWCYKEFTTTGDQLTGTTPEGCEAVTDWKECTPGTCTSKDYMGLGIEDFICDDAEDCIQEPEFVSALENHYVSRLTCPACSALPGGFTLSAGGEDGPSMCYKNCKVDCIEAGCPQHATCEYDNIQLDGTQHYNSGDCVATGNPNCPIKSITCDSGYELNEDETECVPKEYTITLNKNGGSGVINDEGATEDAKMKCTFGEYCQLPGSDGTTPLTRNLYTFTGWGTKADCYDGEPAMSFTEDTPKTIYACWTPTSKQCTAGTYYNGSELVACPAGMYCPGTGTLTPGTAGCGNQCPSGGTSALGSEEVTACYMPCNETPKVDNSIEVISDGAKYYDSESKKYPACTYTVKCEEGFTPYNGENPACVPDGECPPNYYCDEDGQHACPDGGLSEAGSTSITQCYKILEDWEKFLNGNADAKCFYQGTMDSGGYTNCSIYAVNQCNTGYYYDGYPILNAQACSEVDSGYYGPTEYSEDRHLVSQTICPADTDAEMMIESDKLADSIDKCYKICALEVEHSTKVNAFEGDTKYYNTGSQKYDSCKFNIECEIGYTVKDNQTENPYCDPNKYTVTFDANNATAGSAPASIECTFDKNCTLPATTGLSRTGYSNPGKWCTSADGTGTCFYAGQEQTSNISSGGINITLYAAWTPQVYAITLDDNGATSAGAPKTVYLKYNTGWFSDSGATTSISRMSTLPEKTVYEFAGYYTEKSGGKQIISTTGELSMNTDALTFTSQATTIYARWTSGLITCEVGTYYEGTGTQCTTCTENYYCPGGSFEADNGTIQGRNECPISGKSEAGAGNAEQCFNTVDYTATHGSGNQVCYYNNTDKEYNKNCGDINITQCDGGYWLTSQSDTDCTEVGYDYYSENNDTNRYECPDSGKTDTETADTINVCFRTGLDYNATYGSGIQTCYYSYKDTSGNAVYSNNCKDILITLCRGGYYYNLTQNATDCVPVGKGYYSTESINRAPCPNPDSSTPGDPTTAHETAGQSIEFCRIEGLPYIADHGSGTYNCYYTGMGNNGALYSTNCDNYSMNKCDAGYYSAPSINQKDCTEVGFGYYSPEGPITRNECPKDGLNKGTTETKTSSVITQCLLDGLSCKTPGGASGTQMCYYNSSSFDYSYNCTECVSSGSGDDCPAGTYYDETQQDCVPCPDGGTSAIGSSSATMCYKTVDYTATHGSGNQICDYDNYTFTYSANCRNIKITQCNGGYWLESQSDTDCTEVGYNYYSPDGQTTRNECPDGGETDTETADVISACYLDNIPCETQNGYDGTQTCYYNTTKLDYSSQCTTCAVGGDGGDCPEGTYYDDATQDCVECPEGMICDGDPDHPNPKSCYDLTRGQYPLSEPGTSSVDYCYRECALADNAVSMTGVDYYKATDTCAIEKCNDGYTLENGVCEICPEGMICDPDDPSQGKYTCDDLTGGTHIYSEAGSSSINDCYTTCEGYIEDNCTITPVSKISYYPNACNFECLSETGNPCKIVDGVCKETGCKPGFEMINGVCQPCNRENALSYTTGGVCQIAVCVNGYHPEGDACKPNVKDCTSSAPNALYAEMTWDFDKNAFGLCTVKECDYGYHIASNACVSDAQPCNVENGVGFKEWDYNLNTWGECVATKCNPGYTSDPSLTNDRTKQCGECRNKYSVLGELAVSSYIQECEIASCLYQGQLYNLEYNECVPICPLTEYEDETGTMVWDSGSKKCIRTCKEGYTSW